MFTNDRANAVLKFNYDTYKFKCIKKNKTILG